jgi:N-acetylmuramoyl-L-alanine amidase
MREIKYIVVHCTATSANTSIIAIQNYWREHLKWNSPGYHFIIKASGEIVELQPIEKLANGVRGYNQNSIHISYIGGINGKDTRTVEQTISLKRKIQELLKEFPNAEIKGHRDFPNVRKTCPNFDVCKWVDEWNC